MCSWSLERWWNDGINVAFGRHWGLTSCGLASRIQSLSVRAAGEDTSLWHHFQGAGSWCCHGDWSELSTGQHSSRWGGSISLGGNRYQAVGIDKPCFGPWPVWKCWMSEFSTFGISEMGMGHRHEGRPRSSGCCQQYGIPRYSNRVTRIKCITNLGLVSIMCIAHIVSCRSNIQFSSLLRSFLEIGLRGGVEFVETKTIAMWSPFGLAECGGEEDLGSSGDEDAPSSG